MSKNIGIILSLKDKCSPQLQKIADKMGITVEQAKKIDRQIQKTAKQMQAGFRTAATAVTAAAGAVAAGCGLLINQTMEAGDRVDKMSQKIGLSRKAFQQWDYIMSQSGSDIDKMQVGMKTLAQQMVNSTKKGSEAEKIFKRLGVSVKNSHGQFISQEEAFERIVIAFQKMPDGIEKANMAQKLFGKTGSDLRPLLNGVRGNVVELKKKYEELGLGMSEDAVNAAVKLTDTMDTVKRALGAVGWSIGAELLPVIQKMADQFIKELPQIKAAVIPPS